MEKVQRKVREFQMRRAVILSAAEKIFSVSGFHQVTVAQIAAASGFSTGFLYQFFDGKEHLYTAMISEKLDLMYAVIDAEVKAVKNTENKIAALIGAHLRFVQDHKDFCRIFLRGASDALSGVMTEVRRKVMDDYLRQLSLIENILKDGVKKGVIRTLPTQEMAGALIHLIRAASAHWLMLPSDEPLVSQKDFIMDVFLHGVMKHA
ncbi:MAG: TetR/AcrR family transcriptional regulator [Smithellaceae bacterium]